MDLQKFLKDEITYATEPVNAVPRMKRKIVVEYLSQRLEDLEKEEMVLQEAEKVVARKVAKVAKVSKDIPSFQKY
tara:strand:+ start:7345 stop:7569 length:225 start_codon:yes stop_codon:yes gene_type:complete